MNRYAVTLRTDGRDTVVEVDAETACAARDAAEVHGPGEAVAVRLLARLSFSCRVRDGRQH